MFKKEDLQMKAEVKSLNFHYGTKKVLNSVNMPIYNNKITALIGPSGCGKTTLLRCFNRMHDLYNQPKYEGEILLYPDAHNILGREIDPIEVRMRIGMVFQKPNPFPKSIFPKFCCCLSSLARSSQAPITCFGKSLQHLSGPGS
jgi:phosphate transport system ATP-binding protein